jgi:DNA (cytosine-5)-methyltransferase 1
MRVLNLYAGIGGNRKLWTGCEVTAVEIDSLIAIAYQKHFPNDRVLIGDAHEYLLNHYKEFDLIWSSRPCVSHSAVRKNLYVGARGGKPVYPDMGLYVFNQAFSREAE